MMSLRYICLGAAIVPLLVTLQGCGPAPATASSLATLNKTQWITQANSSLNTLYQGLAGITATLNMTYGNQTDLPAPALLSAKTLFLSTYNSANVGKLQQYGLPAWTSALVQRLSPIQQCASMSVSNSSYTTEVFFKCLRDGAASISSARQWAQSQQLASYLTTTPAPYWDLSASSVAGAPSAWANSKSLNTGPGASDSLGSATSLGSKALGSSGSYMQIWQFPVLFLVLCVSGAAISAAVLMCVMPRKKAKKTMNRKQGAPSPAMAASSGAGDNGKDMGIFNYKVPASSDLSAFVEGRSTPSYLLPVIPPTVPIVRSERVLMTVAAASAPKVVTREEPAVISTEDDSGSFVSIPETAATGSAVPLLGAPVNWATPSFMQQSSLTAQAGSSASAYYASRAAAGVFAYKAPPVDPFQLSTPVITTFAAPITMAAPMTAAVTYAAPVGTYAAPGTTYAVPLNTYSAPRFAPPLAPPMAGPVPSGTDVNEMLDSRLEYMLHYLQMGKAVAVDDLESSQSRDQEVLQLVSGATAWKGESRSPQEVWNKIAELDGAMTRIVGS